MPSWSGFARDAPDFAAAAERLLRGDDGLPIAFLATATRGGVPHLGPVCPIFCGDQLYLCAGAKTPKARDLRAGGAFSLHAFLGESDEEFQLRGSAEGVHDSAERRAVHEAIPFASFDPHDPIFRFSIEHALWVFWERVGQPDTKAVRRRWSAGDRR